MLVPVTQTRPVGYVGVMQHRQARGDQFTSSLPDALLTHILKLADHETRLSAHLVCQRWTRILRRPTCLDLWEPLPVLHLFKDKLSPAGTAHLSRGMAWLATRAAGIAVAHFCFPGQWMLERLAPEEPGESPVKDEAEHVCQQQLPRLIGRLDYMQESIRMAFSCAGMRTT